VTKKLFIKTYGCQMNVYDSTRMADVLAPLGYALSDGPDGADMVILNTCHIREKAADKVFSELGRLKVLKESRRAEGGRMILAVAGCVAQAEGAEILRRAPQVDIVLGPQTYHRLPEMVARASRAADGEGVLDTDFPPEPKFDHLPQPSVEGASAFLSIQEGCDKFCTFCVVPYTRGAEYSRPVADVLAEAKSMVERGVREITLLGQNVNAYHGAGGEAGLGGLIRDLCKIKGLERLRYATSHPRDLTPDLIAAHRDVEALTPFVHLPVQSGSDRILKAMNRGHNREQYLAWATALKEARPGLQLSSDFIVGFPGESDKDFEETMDLARRVGFIQSYSFKYSPRPGTPASAMPDQVPEAVKDARLQALQALLFEQQAAFNATCVGRVMSVVLDRPGRYAGQLVGRSAYMQPVHVFAHGAEGILGRAVDLEITEATSLSLTGVLCDVRERASA